MITYVIKKRDLKLSLRVQISLHKTRLKLGCPCQPDNGALFSDYGLDQHRLKWVHFLRYKTKQVTSELFGKLTFLAVQVVQK